MDGNAVMVLQRIADALETIDGTLYRIHVLMEENADPRVVARANRRYRDPDYKDPEVVDFEIAGRHCYEESHRGRGHFRPWDDLAVAEKARWRRVARQALLAEGVRC